MHQRSYPGFITLLLATFSLGIIARADNQWVWNSTTGNWSLDANWSPATLPESGGGASLVFAGNASYEATNDIGSFTLHRLSFANTSGTVTLSGSPVTNDLNFTRSDAAVLPSINLTGSGNATITAPVIWNANTIVTNSGSGTLLFNGAQTFATGTKQTFVNDGTGQITLADAIGYGTLGASGGLVLNLINNNPAASTLNIGNLGGLGNVTINVGGTGTVRSGGSAGGDLFSGSAVLNVLAGGTFDFNGNGETMGAISGAGTIRSTVGITSTTSGYFVFSGKMTGVGGFLTVGGAGTTLVLAGSTSDYTGLTTITNGRLIVSANAPSGSAGALGNATSEVLVGNTSGTARAILVIDTPGVTIGRNIRVQSGNTGISIIGGLNTSGTVTYSGDITLGTNNGVAKGVTLSAAVGGTVEFTGRLARAMGATGTTDTLTIAGGGTVVLRGNNLFSGTTSVDAGTLWLDYSGNNGGKIASSAALILNGGSLKLTGNDDGATEQNISELILGNGTTPLGGGGSITVTSGPEQNATLSLGTITRHDGATVDFAPIGVGTGMTNINTTTGNSPAGILGGYATFNHSGWAMVDGDGNVTAYDGTSYTISFGSNQHTSLASNSAVTSGGATTHSLRFTSAAALTFAAASNVLTLESGGILVAASTAGATSIGTTTVRGSLATTNGELIIHQHATSGALTINSVISGTNLTKTGNGTLVLTGNNTYTGTTFINGGTVTVTAAANLGAATADVVINGGTLAVTSGSPGTISAANRTITVGPGGATFNFTANVAFEGGGLRGSGTIIKTGTGTWSVGSNASSFNGEIILNDGALTLASPQFSSVAGITVNSGATYGINDDIADNFNLVAGGRIVLNGNGFGGNGALRLTDQNAAVVAADPRTTISREIVLQTTSRIQIDNGTAAGSLSQLTLADKVTGAGALVKAGAGVLVLSSRDNSYGGGTRIEAGILRVDSGNDRLPTNTTVTLGAGASSGILQLNGWSQKIAGLTTSGTGTANAVIGGSAVTSLLVLEVASGTQTYAGTLGANGTGNTHLNNNLGLNKDGEGAMVLSGNNTYNGATVVTKGALVLGHANALGNGGASLSSANAGTTVAAGATLDLNGQSNVHEIIALNGTGVGGAGALVNNSTTAASLGSGIASLSMASGATTSGWSAGASVSISPPGGGGSPATAAARLSLSQASISLTNGGSGFGLTPVVSVSGGNGAVITARVGVTTASYTINSGTTTYSVAPTVTLQNGAKAEAILGPDGKVIGINVTDPGVGFSATPTIAFAGGSVLVAGTNPTGTGNNNNYTITALTLVSPGSGFTSVPTITITGGTGATAVAIDGNFTLDGLVITDNGSGYTTPPEVTLSGGSATATANLASVVLTSDSSIGGTGDLTIHSVISGDHGLTKTGAGVTTLTAENTYTGFTIVNGGILQIGKAGHGTTGTGDVLVNNGQFVGTGSVLGSNFTLASGATLQAGDIVSGTTTGNGTLTFAPASGTGSYTLAGGSKVILSITGATVTDATFGGHAVGTEGYDVFVNGITGVGDHDLLVFEGDDGSTLTFAADVTILGSSFAPQAGQIFNLLDWSSLIATDFSGFNLGDIIRDGSSDNGSQFDLPDISGTGYAWDVSHFLSSGNLVVVAMVIPEPGRAGLLALGLAGLLWRRRRKISIIRTLPVPDVHSSSSGEKNLIPPMERNSARLVTPWLTFERSSESRESAPLFRR